MCQQFERGMMDEKVRLGKVTDVRLFVNLYVFQVKIWAMELFSGVIDKISLVLLKYS